MRVITEYLPDGASPDSRIVRVGPDAPDENTALVVHANGYLVDVDVWLPCAKALVAHAASQNQPMEVVLHDSPITGRASHAAAYKAELLARVVRHATHRGGVPVRLLGHSDGWTATVPVATDLVSDGHPIESVIGWNPNGITPIGRTVRSLTAKTGVGIREIVTNVKYLGGSPAARHLARNAIRHIGSNVPAAVTGGRHMLMADCLTETVELHGKLGVDGSRRLQLTGGTDDIVCPADLMKANLRDAGFPDQDFSVLEMDHAGPLRNLRLIPALYDAIMLRRLAEAPSTDSASKLYETSFLNE